MAFLPAPGVDFDTLRDDAARLSTLTPILASLSQTRTDVVLNHFIATEQGLHATFPGHGGFPPEYDPRKRTWYQFAKLDNTVVWTPPTIDATTGRLTITVAAPLIDDDGQFLGVTAVDVVVTQLLGAENLDISVSPSEQQLIVIPDDGLHELRRRAGITRPEGESLIIYAQKTYQIDTNDWRTDPALKPFALDDPEHNRLINLAVRQNQSRLIRTRIDDKDVFVSIAPMGVDTGRSTASVVTIVPVADVVALANTVSSQFAQATNAQLIANISIAVLVLAGVVLIAFRGSHNVTRPIKELSEAAQRVAEGDLDVHLLSADKPGKDELTEMARAFDAMIPKLRDQLRLRHSLDLAMEVQQALLPCEPPDFPGLDLYGLSAYCDETGGDYYDFLTIEPIGPERLGIVVGDVTGHGIAAALLMTTARALLRTHASMPGSLAQTIGAINRALTEDAVEGRFMTLAFLLYDKPANTIRWVNAGHDPALLYDPDTDTFSELTAEGIPLGIIKDWQYEESSGPTLTTGQLLVIGTDGIWEQRNDQDDMFGKQRLRQIIRNNARKSSREIADAVVAAVHTHRASIPQSDDITLVVIRAL
jgi:phosphoserine phosphatase RsbU/P